MAIIRVTVKAYPDGEYSLAEHEYLCKGFWDIISVGDFYTCVRDLPKKACEKAWNIRPRKAGQTASFYYCAF